MRLGSSSVGTWLGGSRMPRPRGNNLKWQGALRAEYLYARYFTLRICVHSPWDFRRSSPSPHPHPTKIQNTPPLGYPHRGQKRFRARFCARLEPLHAYTMCVSFIQYIHATRAPTFRAINGDFGSYISTFHHFV